MDTNEKNVVFTDITIPKNDENDKVLNYFDAFSIEEDFEYEGGKGEEEEEQDIEEEQEQTEKEKWSDEESVWNVVSDRSDEREKYGEEFHEEEEVGEAEEISLSPSVFTTEKSEEEVRHVEDSDHVFPEIPAEVSADREALVQKLKELLPELRNLRRKNRLLELWVYRHMQKGQQRVTPPGRIRDPERKEEIYREALRSYKMRVDEISTQQSELTYEFETYTEKLNSMKREDDQILQEFLELQREISVGLVFSKTGKKITDKMMNALTRRQIERREILARNRLRYIRLQHRLEDIHAQLKRLETLGENMTTMDYEALLIAHIGYKDKVDERDQELEKLRFKIAKTVNGVAHYKEKEVCVVEDIDLEERKLTECREENTRVRERVNMVHSGLNNIRETMYYKKLEAGLLLAPQELVEMEKMMKRRDNLKTNITKVELQIAEMGPRKRSLRTKSQIYKSASESNNLW